LPVSSSGHLALVPRALEWPYSDLDPELRKSFEVALHAGTACALLIGLRREVAEYVRTFGGRNVVTLTLSFAPAALVAWHLERTIEGPLSEPLPIVLALLGGSAAMALADRAPEERHRDDARPLDALVIGLAQACALLPGVSRNGATLAAARARLFTREQANLLSRTVALPVIAGAALLKAVRLRRRGTHPALRRAIVAGAGASFASCACSGWRCWSWCSPRSSPRSSCSPRTPVRTPTSASSSSTTCPTR
jgi:undecaprenyl-diphosphatase